MEVRSNIKHLDNVIRVFEGYQATPCFVIAVFLFRLILSRAGVKVCCASGDNGSADESPARWDGKPHVDFPSSSPFALGCGGTKLNGSGTTIDQEVVWNEGAKGGAGGGGVSNIFALPTYQAQVNVPKSPTGKRGRSVPDVAGDADPATGYQVFVGGQSIVVGGTSAVAPLWAGLLALINQRLVGQGSKTVGFLNPFLYHFPANAVVFRNIHAQ